MELAASSLFDRSCRSGEEAGRKTAMTTWGHGRRLQLALPCGSVKRVLGHAEQACGFLGSNQVSAPMLDCKRDSKSLHLARVEPAVSARSDDRKENPFGDGPNDSRPADAKTLCCCV
jgi:hypothetical protein